nr:ATP synthase F0 subunit 6 [Nelidina sp. n.]
MMMNLFSMFDPSTGYLSLNWMSMMLIFLIPSCFWKTPSKIMYMIMLVFNNLLKEIMMNTKNLKSCLIFMTLFFYILTNNLFSLFPYIFSSSAQLVFSLSLSLTLWMSIMMYGWTMKTNKMFSHLIPVSTPTLLMPFMVLIESTSNIIRPWSLAIRLSANMIAGHILMSLLSNSMNNLLMMFMLMSLIMMFLMFETAVSFIQSYVFMTLTSLYYSEI